MYEDALKPLKKVLLTMNTIKSFSLCGENGVKARQRRGRQKLLQEALALDPGYVEALHTLLAVYHKEESFEEIIDLIQEVRGYGKKIRNTIGIWRYIQAWSNTLKRKSFEAAYLHYQDDRDFLYEYAHFLLEEGLQKEALPLLKQVLSMDGTNEELEETILRIEDEFLR